MESNPKQQLVERITQSDRILILPGSADGDSIGSALALKLFLDKLGKQATLLSEALPDSLSFLPGAELIQSELPGARDFIVSLDASQAEAEKLSYNTKDGRLNIVITLKSGEISPQSVEFLAGRPRIDLIITVDNPTLSRLGKVYQEHRELFDGNIPLANIDHHLTNDLFGQINWVDVAASSTAEMLVGLFEAINRQLIDEKVATSLLAGALADTGSFQNANTTPKSLTVAAQLLGFGAKHEEVVWHLFRKKSFGTLQLWGRALSRLRFDEKLGMVWASLLPNDFSETNGESEGLIDLLLKSAEGSKFALLLKEREPGQTEGSLRSTRRDFDVLPLARKLGGGGHTQAAAFQLEGGLEENLDKILIRLREQSLLEETARPSLE